MKKFSIDMIRNIALVGHQSSGKTILGEAVLFDSGVTSRIGKIEDGNTVFDSAPDEIEVEWALCSDTLCIPGRTRVTF